MSESKMLVGSQEVQLEQAVVFTQQRDYIRTDYSSVRPFDSRQWPDAHYYFLQHNSSPLMHDALAREAAKLGYSDADEAANLLCGIFTLRH